MAKTLKQLLALEKSLETKVNALDRKEEALLDKIEKLELELDAVQGDITDISSQIEYVEDEITHFDNEQEQIDAGEIPSPAQQKLIETQKFSYGVNFLRSKPVKGKSVFVSTRRFGTKKEAAHHGARFAKKHNHKDFSVVVLNERPSAWVNWKTGKTNPAI